MIAVRTSSMVAPTIDAYIAAWNLAKDHLEKHWSRWRGRIAVILTLFAQTQSGEKCVAISKIFEQNIRPVDLQLG